MTKCRQYPTQEVQKGHPCEERTIEKKDKKDLLKDKKDLLRTYRTQ